MGIDPLLAARAELTNILAPSDIRWRFVPNYRGPLIDDKKGGLIHNVEKDILAYSALTTVFLIGQ